MASKKLFAIALATLLLSCGGGGSSSSDVAYMPPPPTVQRHDILYGYFLDFNNQNAETAGTVNLAHESGWFGDDATIASMRQHNLPTMLSVRLDTLPATLTHLQQAGVLHQVIALYPVDEPDLNMTDQDVLTQNATIRQIASGYPELVNVKLAVIYANRGTFPGIASYDWIGMDNYPLGSAILISPLWTRMVGLLRPDQRIILVPPGGDPWRQDPEAFRRYAHENPQVVLVLPFMWAQQLPSTAQGIGTNGMAPVYNALGLELIH